MIATEQHPAFTPERISEYVAAHRERLLSILQQLVRTPSPNTPPAGSEDACQSYLAHHLERMGLAAERYSPEIASEHPLYWRGRHYTNRYNVSARRRGTGGGRSLVLSGHVDTVPAGEQPWSRDPFSGDIDGNRLYGRGSNDMKAGVATNLFVMQALQELDIKLAGDVIFESVVDEEFGGANGTLAGRVRGDNADAAVISEPSFLRVCPAQRGGRIAHITLRAPQNSGVLTSDRFPTGIAGSLARFLQAVPEFGELRRRVAPVHPLYSRCADPVPVAVTAISTAPWGMTEPMHVPDTCRVELYWQAMPGETAAELDAQFFAWLDAIGVEAKVEFAIRALPGSAIAADSALVRELAGSARDLLGRAPAIEGIEGPCDMFLFHEFGVPAVLWGARGGNTHGADEYVDIDSVIEAATVLLHFVCRWCR